MALLPQELARSNEGGGVGEFPPDNRVPLVQAQGQVSVAANPLRRARTRCEGLSIGCADGAFGACAGCESLPEPALCLMATDDSHTSPARYSLTWHGITCISLDVLMTGCRQQGPLSVHNTTWRHRGFILHSCRLLHTDTRADLGVVGIHDRLTGGANGDRAVQLALARLGHPCHLHHTASTCSGSRT